MTAMQDDPRWVEYGHARTAAREGGEANRERYRSSLLPFCQLIAEFCPEHVRKHMMSSLVLSARIPFGIVALAFKMTEEEAEHVRNQPPVLSEVESEVDRLRRLPYAQYLRTAHWKAVRAKALEWAGKRCQICNRADLLQVHHRTYERRGCERLPDLTVMCAPCHERHHGIEAAA